MASLELLTSGVLEAGPPPEFSEAFLKAWMLSVVISAAAYGVVFTLTYFCISLLRSMIWTAPKRKKNLLQLYILFMFALSTGSIISGLITMTSAVFSKTPTLLSNPMGKPGTICIVLANWAADGFMLWRCKKLYNGVLSNVRRRMSFLAIGTLGLMSFGLGITYLSLTFIGTLTASLTLFAFACSSLFVNLSITLLITTRIMVLSRSLKRALGKDHVSIYRKIVSMIIESAALVVWVHVAYVVLTVAVPSKIGVPLKSLAGLVPLMNLTQAYVIATLLIVYRVAQGRDESTSHNIDHPELGSSGARQQQRMSLSFANISRSRNGTKVDGEHGHDLDDMEFVKRKTLG